MRRIALCATPSARWGFVAALTLSVFSAPARAEDKADVQVLKAAPARAGCVIGPELVFRSEQQVGRPFEKLCRIGASESEVLAIYDMTGKAVEKARKLACTCGADALVVAYNSSEHVPRTYRSVDVGSTTVTKGKRKFEEVVAFGIRFIERLKLRPTPMKDGFRELTWGQSPSEGFRTLNVYIAPVEFFERPGESMTVGPAEAQEIEYGFLDRRRLAHVRLYFPLSAQAGLKSFLQEMWGPPELSRGPSEMTWTRSDEGTIATLKVEADRVTLFLGSHELLDEAIRRLEEAKVKGSGL